MEIVRQMPTPLHAIFVPVGGGGLIAGIAAYVKTVCPEVKIIGVEPYDANSMALSLFHGQRIMLDNIGRFADGVAMEVVGEETFKLCRELMDGVVLVNQDAICASIKASDGSSIENEILCRFVIPERPGALMKLLDAFGGRWNISMLNYQRQGQNGGDVLVGLKVLSSEMDEFKALANSLGSDYAFEISNETLPLLLHQ
ncbi:hypothetical protein I3842_14G107700 [Carya illinoinensis]|uniref:ACT-like domain-containing protein n=1 Tax=Carya illinoinensis TaxID=32201 RepID=A0A922AHG1_CARIL|nr:hypothetical protein I3842_14G107700 [Carya illinoinensis]